MKTITVKGKVYEIGKLYFCTEKERFGYLSGTYKGTSGPKIKMDNTDFTWYSRSLEVVEPEPIGTIKDAPIELEIGSWYLVEIAGGTKMVMYWDGAIFTECVGANGDSCGGAAKVGGLKVISKLRASS